MLSKSKVGVVTWCKSRNYGTNLQAFALINKLRDLGYESFLIEPFDRQCFSWKSTIKYYLKNAGLLDLINRPKTLDVQGYKLSEFMIEDIPQKQVYTHKEYQKLLLDFKVFISGSDQIWNPNYVNEFQLLGFATNCKKIAYASSIGTSMIPDDKKELYINNLSGFDHISLRESTGARIISELLPEKNPRTVLDPTFLLEPEEWTAFGKKGILEFVLPARYLLVYLIGNQSFYSDYIKNIASHYDDIPIIIIKSIENEGFNIEGAINYRDAGPREFVKLISYATAVCTDSFHACAISINLSKQFVVLKRHSDETLDSQNSRIYDLLTHFNLSDRLFDSINARLDEINYTDISCQLRNERSECINYLQNSIEH
ncbi:polysaccharide pyruvyl transferase family protein [uncultured Duncaniella sp.]|uniref:polysaccharide pyruvyl transferase family protein n=1 Tax=uncultured Duncaniella sp. TaxID=2768039 RepID=UPI002630948D|nr:polysaccharide pyruvyl transferase family protein [uncultured Duncaniella sp.]